MGKAWLWEVQTTRRMRRMAVASAVAAAGVALLTALGGCGGGGPETIAPIGTTESSPAVGASDAGNENDQAAAAAATAPIVLYPPISTIVADGSPARFSVTALGAGPLRYQWQRNGVDIAGARGQTLPLMPAMQSDHLAHYQVVVSNPAGSVTSAPAVLVVVPAGTPMEWD